MVCKAKQYNDQMICGYCGTQWDVDDPEPPQCAEHRVAASHIGCSTIDVGECDERDCD